MLENPKVKAGKFLGSEGRLKDATITGRCTIIGRVGSAIGLTLVDLEDKPFAAYTFGDRIIIVPIPTAEDTHGKDDHGKTSEEKAEAKPKAKR